MTHEEAQEYIETHSFVTTGEGVYEIIELKANSMILNPWSQNCWDDECGVEYPLSSLFPYDGPI
jgi:high-affinity Fe2+/Pb2+ permease